MLVYFLSVLGVVSGAILDFAPYGYHAKIGIPAAERIKTLEDGILLNKNRIVGGEVAPTNSHPYVGGLVISFDSISGVSACGSSVVSPNRLVTAAHCWFDGYFQANQFEVVLGSPLLFWGGTRIPTSTVVVHPTWNPNTLVADIAIIYLPLNVAYSASIQPINLPLTNEDFAGQWAIAAGYGMTSDNEVSISWETHLRHVNVQVITLAQCQATFGIWARPTNICTSGAGGVGICGGDSGGPLIIDRSGQRFLVGVSSFRAWAGCEASQPSGFTRVTSYTNFILQNL